MFLKDPFVIGPAVPLTEKQKAALELEQEWQAAGKPSLEQHIEEHNRIASDALKRSFGEK